VAQLLERIRIVLVEPTIPGNVGSAARAMANLGLTQMVLVRPQRWNNKQAYRMAAGAHWVYQKAPRVDTVEEAIAGCQQVWATTGRTRKWSWPRIPPHEAAERSIAAVRGDADVAWLFGREDFGLANTDLELATGLVHFPTSDLHSSLNLSQAVLLVCWLIKEAMDGVSPPHQHKTASADAIRGAVEDLEALLGRINFNRGRNPQQLRVMAQQILGNSGIRPFEVNSVRGILRKLAWHLDHPGHNSPPTPEDPFVRIWQRRQEPDGIAHQDSLSDDELDQDDSSDIPPAGSPDHQPAD